MIIELGLVVGETYPDAHRQEDCRQNILRHLQNPGNPDMFRASGVDPVAAAMEAYVEYEDCLHVTESLLLERSCSPLTKV